MVDQTRLLPTLRHKEKFAYQWPALARADGAAGHAITKTSQRI
jgi:hypothetical protein